MKYSTIISELIKQNTKAEVIIFGDYTYGACNYDEITSLMMGITKYIHFGHSQLVKPYFLKLENVLFISCQLKIDNQQIQQLCVNIINQCKQYKIKCITFTSTAQTYNLVQKIINNIEDNYKQIKIIQQQILPLHKNEILGCTCFNNYQQILKEFQISLNEFGLFSLVDGMFHYESLQISNNVQFKVFQVDVIQNKINLAYGNVKTKLIYKQQQLKKININKCQNALIILGTLGQQGSITTLKQLQQKFQQRNINYDTILLSEIYPNKINTTYDIIVQLACPRLTFDWYQDFQENVLNIEEINKLLEKRDIEDTYQLDNFKCQYLDIIE